MNERTWYLVCLFCALLYVGSQIGLAVARKIPDSGARDGRATPGLTDYTRGMKNGV